MTDERRQHLRFTFRCSARVALPDRRVISAEIMDISEGGFAFICSELVAKGAAIKVELTFHSKNKKMQIKALAKVIFNIALADNQGARVGAAFTKVNPDDVPALTQLLETLTQANQQ